MPTLLTALDHRTDPDFHNGWLMRAYEAVDGRLTPEIQRDLEDVLATIKQRLARFERGGRITLWRGTTRPAEPPFGVHWAESRAAAERHGPHIIEADVDPHQIDWVATVYRRICWPKEAEISLFPEADVQARRGSRPAVGAIAEAAAPTFPKLTRKGLGTVGRGLIPATPENVAQAREFALRKWVERFHEINRHRDDPGPPPADLSRSCKFTSLFAQALFGGRLRGNEGHQFVELEDGKRVDLNIDAADVREMAAGFAKDRKTGYVNVPFQGMVYRGNPHAHDPAWFGHSDHIDSLGTVLPRVQQWVREFIAERSPSA